MRTALLAATVALVSACSNATAPAVSKASVPSAPARTATTGDRPMPEPTPDERRRPLREPTSIPPATGWSTVALPAHRAAVEDALALADAAAIGKDEATREARVLLDRARQPRPLGDIDGAWRVRSIQVNDGQGYAYPFFDAGIARDGSGYRFAKTSGSQRRSGRLYAMVGEGLAFLGARTVNEEPRRTYSRVARPGTATPGEYDSAGWLARIGPGELLMVLDADSDRFELYHLRR